MAVFRFSALSDGQSLVFNPSADVLNFDQTTVAAADLRVTQVGSNIRIDVVSGTQAGKDVTLQNVSPLQLATTNVTFADGSKLLFGDATSGTANDNLADSLTGTAGNDLLQGFGGADTMAGGAGNDTYIVSTGDVLSDSGGTDTVLSDVSWTLADGFENLTLTGTGNISATGNNATNILVGNSGNNFFNPRAGDDTILAGAGNDLVRLGGGGLPSYGNKVIDGGAGTDQVEFGGFAKSAIMVDLGAGTLRGGGDAGQGSAQLISIETAIGDGFDDRLNGSDGADSLAGGGGNDTLEGRGGVDTLTGGLGQDLFDFFSSGKGDQVTDFVSGTDKLGFETNVNSFDDIGGPGNFAAGDARFFAAAGATSGHDAGDRVVYNTSTGQLFYDPDGNGAQAAFLVATLQGAPALTATDIVVTHQAGADLIQGTAGNDSLTGSGFSDSISGFAGNDTLDGRGGEDTLRGGDGDDTLIDHENGGPDIPGQLLDGGLGNDTYDLLAFPFDVPPPASIVDAGGVDTVLANHDFVLPDGIENLTLFEGLRGTGNGQNNIIITRASEFGLHQVDAREGNDTIIGGPDRDEMTGGAGNDVFVFSQVPTGGSSPVQSDEIKDFTSGTDRLQFDNAGFTQLGGAGNFAPGDARFVSGAGLTSGQDATDRLIYNTTNGDLYYDADGNGAGASVLVAHLTGAPVLTAADITVTGQSGSGTIQGTEGDDFLIGTPGNDSIDGLGGNDIILGRAGDDTLVGGAGNDSIGDDSDTSQNGGELNVGNDQISGGAGDDEIRIALGNDSVDAGAGNDQILIAGFFGSGTDTIDGGAGVDTLKIDSGTAVVDLAAGTYTDVNDASSHATLTSIEDVTLQAASSLVSGTDVANQLAGYSGDDTLNGRAGNDTLMGDFDGFGNPLAQPTGSDHFVFDQTPGAANADVIVDFHSASDTLDLDVHAMAALGPSGRLVAGDARFHAAAGATGGHDADDRIVYDTTTGNLYYDADGSGAGSGQIIATLQGAPALTATDIVVFGGAGAPGVHIVGTEGNDTLNGTDGNDTIDGLGGDDVLSGGFGTDVLHGGAGNDRLKDREDSNPAAPDTLDGGLGDDIYDFLASPLRTHTTVIVDAGGTDTVWSNHNFTLPAGIENLTLFEGSFGTGNDLDNMIVGFGNINHYTMDGAGGNDTLVGAPNATDDMTGGAGNDVFRFVADPGVGGAQDHVLDFVSGTDTLQFDNTGTGFAALGAAGRFSATDERFFFGQAAHDASDRLIYDGLGLFYDPDGTGPIQQHLIAVVQSSPSMVASDIVIIGNAAAGSSVQGTAGNDSLTGTEGNDSISGLAGADTLNGLGGNDTLDGGAGIDTLNGGLGDDTYIVTAGDVLSDTGGVDTVVTDASWALADGFENLTAVGPAGVGLTGNNAANVLLGNAASNFFNPRGGDDTIRGGDGADLVRLGGGGVPSYGNKLIDGGAGFDTLEFGGFARSAMVVDLATGSLVGGGDAGQGSATLISIERVNGDAFNDRISGSAVAEELNGGGGNDTLDGRGGNDTLTGGLGADTFVFDTAPASGNVDQVTDFVSASDRLNFDNATFTALSADGNFVAGDARFAAGAGFTSGRDASDRLVYDTNTGNLYYDADGNGAGAAQLVATIQGHPALAATDISVI